MEEQAFPCRSALPLKSRLKSILRPVFVPATLLLRRRLIARYLRSTERPKLHVGCGSHLLPGWLNTDFSILNRHSIVYLDARRPLPFEANTFLAILNEHFISYLTLSEAIGFFKECRRVLKAGGVLRTATAGLPFLVGLYSHPDHRTEEYVRWASHEFRLGGYRETPCLVVNNFVYDFKMVYDPECLAWALRESGFSEIVAMAVGHSSHADLRDVEGHGRVIPPAHNDLETFILEAVKQ